QTIFTCLLASAVTLLGAEKKAALANAIGPDLANVKYGAHERNVLDLWFTKSNGPAPLFVYIHGGGWRGGDKSGVPQPLLKFLLEHGVSVASVNYRYSEIAKLPAPVHDAA